MSIAEERTENPIADRPARKGWLAAGGALVLLTLGISGAWIGNLTALEPYKPIFAVIALGFIAAGFRQVYFRKPVVCEPDFCCARPSSVWITKIALWAFLVLVLSALTIGWWAPLLY